jgi:hypothetical protein
MAAEWCVMTEVANGTGSASRYADAIAMNLWPSRGLALHGFEIKVSRGDWLRELKDPAKADLIGAYCDFWWVVTPEGIVQDGELPDGWGLMVPNKGTKLRVVTKASKTTAKSVDRSFVAAMLRRAQDQAPDKLAMEKAVADARTAARELAELSVRDERQRRERAERVIAAVNRGSRLNGGTLNDISAYMDEAAAIEFGRLAALARTPRELSDNTRHAAEAAIRAADGLLTKARAVLAAIEPRDITQGESGRSAPPLGGDQVPSPAALSQEDAEPSRRTEG